MNTSNSHFEFWRTNSDGTPIGNPVKVFTVIGVIMQCPGAIKTSKIRHLCALAKAAGDGWPVDITHFERDSAGTLALVWSGRIYWRDNNAKSESVRPTGNAD